MTDTLWPKSFPTDGAGYLRFDGLSAGRHTLHLGAFAYSFDVPKYAALAVPIAAEVRVK